MKIPEFSQSTGDLRTPEMQLVSEAGAVLWRTLPLICEICVYSRGLVSELYCSIPGWGGIGTGRDSCVSRLSSKSGTE